MALQCWLVVKHLLLILQLSYLSFEDLFSCLLLTSVADLGWFPGFHGTPLLVLTTGLRKLFLWLTLASFSKSFGRKRDD